MKVLVTGDKGYIGSNLVEYLREKEFVVVGYDLKDKKNILLYDELVEAMKGCNIVYHCSAISGHRACEKDPVNAIETNCRGTFNVYMASKETGAKPVFFSSEAVMKSTLYGFTKRVVETFQEEAVILRLSNVYGGKNYELKDVALNRFWCDNPIVVYGGNQTRDFVHINKVLKACLDAQELPFSIYYIRSEYVVPIETVARFFSELRGVPIEFKPMRESG